MKSEIYLKKIQNNALIDALELARCAFWENKDGSRNYKCMDEDGEIHILIGARKFIAEELEDESVLPYEETITMRSK